MARDQVPRRKPVGQAGNYAAPVDTVGMDESMKQVLGVAKNQRRRKKSSPLDAIIKFFKGEK